jgi:hypothetical protein
MKKPRARRSNERGGAMIEFALCFALVWLPLFLGLGQFGFRLVQAIQITQVCRDAGHMHAYGIDFSQTSNKYLLAALAPGLGIDPTGTGGNAEVILSTIVYVDDAQCMAGGYAAGSDCANYKKFVFTRQFVVGKALKISSFGTPSASITDPATGNVQRGGPAKSGYLNDGNAAVGAGFPIGVASGQQSAYVSEMFVQSSVFNWFFPGPAWVTSASFF